MQLFYLPQEEEQEAFIKAIQGKVTEYPALKDGLKAQMIAEALYQSLKTNKWVQIRYGKPE